MLYFVTAEEQSNEELGGASVEYSNESAAQALRYSMELIDGYAKCEGVEWWRIDVHSWDGDPDSFYDAFEDGEVEDGDVMHIDSSMV